MDAKRYNNIKLGIGIGKAIFSFVVLLLFVLLGYSLLLENYISSFVENKYLIFLGFILITGIASSVLFAQDITWSISTIYQIKLLVSGFGKILKVLWLHL